MNQIVLEYSNNEVKLPNFPEIIIRDILESMDIDVLNEAFINKIALRWLVLFIVLLISDIIIRKKNKNIWEEQ